MEISTCAKCKTEKPAKDFSKRNDRRSGLASYCRPCLYAVQVRRWIELKKKAVEYLGGICLDCKRPYYYSAMQFHHRDPAQKDVTWTHLRKRSWNKITLELDKCDLLCANCHAIRHSNDLVA